MKTSRQIARWATGLSILVALIAYASLNHVSAQPAFSRTLAEQDYYTFSVDEDGMGGLPDQSALNAPISPTDRIFVKGRHFYKVGPDGRPGTDDDERVRLFGANLSFAANFPDEQDAVPYARRLRKLGFNAVRLHHLDTQPNDTDIPPRSILGTGPYPTFNPVAIRRLRTFIRALADEGIHVNLNLRVGYRFRPAVDGLPSLDDGLDRPASVGTPIHVYYPELIRRQERYARELITALGLRDNPVLAMVEINNESSLLAAWIGDAWWGVSWHDVIPSAYGKALQAQWIEWIQGRYGTIEKACQAWANCGDADPALLPQTSLAGFTTAPPTLAQRVHAKFSRVLARVGVDHTTDIYHPDPKQLYRYDFLTFLMETDRAYLDRLKAVIHEAANYPVPVTGTQMNYGGVLNFDSHANMDYLDDHVYIGHHVYANGNPWLSQDWRVPAISTSGGGIDQLLALSLRRDDRKPFVISEYNQPFPSPGGSEILPIMAIVASLQDWDGLFFFNYDDSLPPKSAPWYFSLSGDWGKYALTGQSARLFRRFQIPALPLLTLPLTPTQRLHLATQGHIRTQTLEKYLRQVLGVSIDVAWQWQLAQRISFEEKVESHWPGPLPATDSATPDGRIRYQRPQNRILLDIDQASGYFGSLQQDDDVQLGQFRLRAHAAGRQDVQLLLTPEDTPELSRAKRLLVSLGSDTTGTQPGSLPRRPKELIAYPGRPGWLTLEPDPLSKGPSATLAAQAPAWMKRQDISLHLPYPIGQFAVYALDGSGRRMAQLPEDNLRATESGTWVRFHASVATASPWYEIAIEPDALPIQDSLPP